MAPAVRAGRGDVGLRVVTDVQDLAGAGDVAVLLQAGGKVIEHPAMRFGSAGFAGDAQVLVVS